jgi:hypothetical protein
MVMDDVNYAGRGRLQAARERQAEDQIKAFLVRQGDWVMPRLVAQHVRGLGFRDQDTP